jgi:hypothetical protein
MFVVEVIKTTLKISYKRRRGNMRPKKKAFRVEVEETTVNIFSVEADSKDEAMRLFTVGNTIGEFVDGYTADRTITVTLEED